MCVNNDDSAARNTKFSLCCQYFSMETQRRKQKDIKFLAKSLSLYVCWCELSTDVQVFVKRTQGTSVK